MNTHPIRSRAGAGVIAAFALLSGLVATVAYAASPNAFTFIVRTNVATAALVTSESKTITGVPAGGLAVSVSGAGSPQYKIGSGTFTSNPGTITDGQTLTVRHTSSTHASTETLSTVTVGDYSTPFKSVTGATDRTPEPFGFDTQNNVEPGVVVVSNTLTLTDYNTAVSVTAGSGAQYSIDGGAFTATAGTINPGQTLTLRHTSSSQPLGIVKTSVTVGGVTGFFQTRTRSSTPPVNQAPHAFDDGAITDEDTLVVIAVLANDTDDGALDPASVAIQGESHGVATVNGQGQVSFLPDANYFGTDAGFTYTVRDTQGLESNVATVAVTVNAVNDAPVAQDQQALTREDVALNGTLAASDVDGDALSFAKASDPAHGTVTVGSDGSFTYTPAPNFAGEDAFTFTASDDNASSAPATVSIHVDDLVEPDLTVGNASGDEGNSGTSVLTFTISLSREPDGVIVMHYHTIDDSAEAGSDYLATEGDISFGPGQPTTRTVEVTIKGDTGVEADEQFSVFFDTTSGDEYLNCCGGQAAAVGTIVNDDVSDPNLLKIGAAKRSITPTQAQIDGIDEERAFSAGTHLQKFNLGGFGINVGQNLPDPAGDVPGQATTTEPASRRVFVNKAGVQEDTYLRLFAIEDKNGQAVVFVMIDAIGAGNLIQTGVKNAIVAAAGGQGVTVLPENILFGQTHSHTAADLQGLWGGVPQDWVNHILFQAAADAATEAFSSRKPAHLTFKQGYTTEFNNYRRPRIDPNADADGTMTLLQATAEDGMPIGSILQYNAHPTSVGDGNEPRTPHGEYIYGATRWLETHGGGGTALYFNGPIADASPSGSRPGCVNSEIGSGDPSGADFGNVRCRGEGIADYLLHPDHVISSHELAPTLELRSTQVVLPITNPAFLATAGAGSFNRYYNFTELPTDQIPGLTPEQVADLPQVAPVAITTVSRVTLGGADAGLEIVTIPGETTNTMGNYIRGLAKTNVMLTGLTHNSFGYILPEEEFSYVAQDGDDGFLLPFTGYEENVSLGPLTAPLLRSQGWNRLFDMLPTKDVPPAVGSCTDASAPTTCIATVIEERINLLVNSVESCIENGPGGAGCPFGTAGFPDVLPGAGPVDEPVLDTRLIASSADAQLRGCDMLDTSECLLPFPSDWFTVPAAKGSPQGTDNGGTGKRVNFNPLAMPRNAAGKPIDPTEWNRNDGFSPGQLIVTYVPGIGTVKDANHNQLGPITGAVPITDLPRYLDENAPILVIDADTGLRHPIYAEIDLNAGYLLPMQGFGPRQDKKPALLIRPATNFIEGHRYVVVLRNLKNDYGQPLWAGPAFSTCRDRPLDQLAAMPTVQARCAQLDDKVFPVLANAGVARDSRLYLAWDFTVASKRNDTARIVAMRDDAFASLGDTRGSAPGDAGYPAGRAPTYLVTKITENPDGATGKTVRRIQGTITVPSYVVPADPSPLDANPDFYAFRQALRENNADALETIRQQCANSPVDDADPVGVVCDLFDPSTGASASAPPNHLHYVPDASSAASCDADAAQVAGGCALQARYGDGLPDRNPAGDLTTTFTCNIPRIAVSGKGSMADATPGDVKPVRPTLYGHGLLGGQGEGNGQASDFGNVYGFMTCAADWFGFASGDIGNVASALVDLSNFQAIPDGAQQGVLNQLFLARLAAHPDGFAANPSFQVGGVPVFDRREVFYNGNSQGGIMGGVVVAASKDINRGVLGVLGMNYSTLLARSTDFALYSVPLYLSYQDDLERPFVMSLMQMLWDRAENNGYAGSMTDNSAMGGPDNAVLLQPAIGDHQVTMWSAEVMARTVGAKLDRHRVRPERHPDRDASEYMDLPAIDYAGGEHWTGSALAPYDQMFDPATGNEHWNSQNDSRCDGNRTAPPPIGNVPPNREVLFGAGAPFEADGDDFNSDAGGDPHECPRRDPQARCQMSHFLLATPAAGSGESAPEMVDVKDIVVFGDSANTDAGCPVVTLTDAPRSGGTPAGPGFFSQLLSAASTLVDQLTGGDVEGAVATLQGAGELVVAQVTQTVDGITGGGDTGPDGVWLRGDMHVHDDHSADGSGSRQGLGQGAPGNVSLSDQLTFGQTQRLDFMNFNDHRTFDQHYDPQWTSSSMLLITGEEANSSPHANIFGAMDMINQGNNPGGAPEFRRVQQSIWDAHAQGAAWQTNHPDDGEVETENADGSIVPNNNAFATGPDLCEIWNRGTRNAPKIAYCENRWNAGYRFGISGASDNHFKELWPVAGPGTPLTHVFAAEKTTPALLDALRAGRTAINLNDRAPFVTLTGDFDGDGKFEAVGGDEVRLAQGASATLRVDIDNGAGATVYVYRMPGKIAGAFKTFQSTGGPEHFDFTVTASNAQDWYRVEVRGAGDPDAAAYGDPANPVDQDVPLRALTAPIFISTGAFASPDSPQLPADQGAEDGAVALFGDASDNAFAGFADVAVASGVTHAVAEVRSGHANHVLYRARRADGSLGEPLDLSPDSGLARQPTIAASGNDVWVAFQDERSGELPHNPQIFLRHSADGGASWDGEVQLSDSAARAQRPDIALLDAATPVVVWEDNTGGAFDVLARVIGRDSAPVNLSSAGKTVTPGNTVDSRSAIYPASVSPKVAVSASGAIAVAWQDNRFDVDPGWTGHTNSAEEISTEQPTRCTDEMQRAFGEFEPPDQNECVFSEHGTEMDDWEILAATFDGSSWTAPADVSNSPTQADRHATVAYAADGSLHVAWDSKKADPAGPRPEIRTSTLTSGTWSAAQPVAKDANTMSQRPSFGADAGGLSLFWMDGRSADWRWRVRRANLAGSGWSDAGFVTGKGNGTWASYDNGALVFTSDRAATREQRKPQQVFLLPLATAEPPADADGDGVADANDQCPNEAGPASNGGCPVVTPTDTDGDGVPDASDACPNDAGPASNNGCPIVTPPDADGDGVPDSSDTCPNTPAGTPVDANGCPVEEPAGFPLCEDFYEHHCLSEVPVVGEAIQGAIDTVYNTVTGGGTPGGEPPPVIVQDPVDPCTGPAGDPAEGTPEFAARDAANIYCTQQRREDTAQNPAIQQYMLGNYGGDPYRDPARNENKRFRHAYVDIPHAAPGSFPQGEQDGTSFHYGSDTKPEVYMPCAAGTCTGMPAGLQTFEPPYPVVIVLHGAASDKKHLYWASQPLAEHGYFVLTANGTANTLPDVLLDWLFDPNNPYAAQLDLNRVGITGHSLGAENSTRTQGDPRVSSIVAWDPCDGSGANECKNSKGSRLHDKGAAAQTPTLFLTADYLGFPGYPQPQASVPDDLRVTGYEILRNNGVDTMLVTTRATTHLDFAGAFTFGNRLNEATSLYYTMAWFDRYLNGKLAVDGDGNVVTSHGRNDAEERAYRQSLADAAFAHLTASKFDGLVDLHNISIGFYDHSKALASGDPMDGNVPFRVKDLALADRLSFYHRSVCTITRPDLLNGNGGKNDAKLAIVDTTPAGDMRKTGCTVAQAPVDSDNDGVPDDQDAFPNDPGESHDADGDGTGDNADTDDDNDGVADASDECPTQAGTGANGCPVEEGDSFPMCDPFFQTDYCVRDLDGFVPGAGTAIQEAANTVYDTLNGGGGEPPPPPVAGGDSLVGCALNQDPDKCQAALESVAGLQDCEFDESGLNCAYEIAHDAIGVGDASTFLRGLIQQCYASPGAPVCQAIRSTADSTDAVSVAVASMPIPRGDLVYTEDGNSTPSVKTVDGAIDDWMAQGSRIGGTDVYEFGEHVYTDFLFDAYGADDGDDARRWATLALLGEISSRTERVDALQQAGSDQLDVPPPGGTTDGDHYGNGANREDGTDLTEVRWAADASDLYFLARVSRLQDPANLVVVVLADTESGSGMNGLDAGLTTDAFDRAVVLRNGSARAINLLTGASADVGTAAVSAAGYDNALEASLPRALLERPDGKLRVAVFTAREQDGHLVPANVAYRHHEPVTVYSERVQALALFAGSIDAFTDQINVANLASGRTQLARPGFGYHERQFISGANISAEGDTENGRLQPYGVFVPHAPALNAGNQTRMTIWTHYRGGKTHSGAAWTPRLFWELGEEQGNIVVSPRGRGTSTWYTTRAHQDFFEVFADVAGTGILGQYAEQNLPADSQAGASGLFSVDPAHVYISGYSMGGYATYLFSGLYPDLFAGGFSQSGAVTQGAWTGVGPEPGEPGTEVCGYTAPDDFPEVGGGSPCFIEANEGRANAQLNFRLLENTRHVPITINHGTNDELALTPGAVRMGARLAELQYRYDTTTFIGYEHFTQAIMDEWRDGAHYLNLHESPANPRVVTYKVVPALVKAINEVHVDQWNDRQAFTFHPDGAYWVDDLVVRDGADGVITEGQPVPFGQIDAESGRLAGISYVPVPRTGTDVDTDDPEAFASDPYVSTNFVSPTNHSTPFVRHSLYWQKTGDLAGDANTFSATLVNLSAAKLDLTRMGFEGHYDAAIDGEVKSDGAATLTLAHVGADMTVCVGGEPTGGVNTGGSATVALASGANAIRLVPGLGASCDGGSTPPPAPAADRPDYADLCASYGIAGSEPVCGALRTAETTLRENCESNGGPEGFCTLTGGNLHALIETCYANDPADGALPACRVVASFVEGAAGYCREFSSASGGAQPPEFCALIGGVLVSEGVLQQYEASWTHRALGLQSRLGFALPLAQTTLLHTHNSFNATTNNAPPTLSGSDFNQYYSIPDQLRMDVRAVEMDVHWMPGRAGDAGSMGFEPMLCHGRGGSELNAGCTSERPLREGLAEFRAWLDAHPDEVVMLYIEDDIGGGYTGSDETAYATTAQVVEDEIGPRVYRPADHGSRCDNNQAAGAGSTSWLNVSRTQILDAGRQVLLITETCGQGAAWDRLFHQKNDGNWTQGTQGSYDGFTYEGGCRMPDDAGFMNGRHRKFTRVWEDTTVVTATAGGGAPASVTPAVTRELMRCGMSLPGFDRLVPQDGRLEAAVWSWAKDEPVASDTLNCAALNAEGRFFAADCAQPRPHACVDDANPDSWSISADAAEWGEAACPEGTHFGVPANGYANEQLKGAAAGSEVWLNYTDVSGDGNWIAAAGAAPAGPAVEPPPVEGSACTDLGLPGAICDGLSSVMDAFTQAVDHVFGADPHPTAVLSPALQACHDAGVDGAVCARADDLAMADTGLSRWVDPRIGSTPPGFTNPGPTAPYGMVQPGPDTEGPLNFGGYYFHNTLVSGFSQVHMSAGVYKAGYFPVLPFTGERTAGEIPDDHPMPEYSSGFDHATEAADAGYYSTVLTRYAVHVELTATERVGFHRYTFLDSTQAPRVLIDVARMNGAYRSGAVRVNGSVISGRIDADFPVFFAARFSAPFTAQTFAGAAVGAAPASLDAGNSGVTLDFASAPSSILMKMGISYTDEAGALANLDAEIPDWNFDAVHAATRAKWDDALARIEVEGGTYADRVSFYTALYHAQQFPNLHSDVDGRYRGPDRAIYSDTRPHYSQFSSWDSYRGQNQLQAEIVPGLYDDMIHSLIAFGEQNGGVMPRWQEGSIDASHMTGDPIIPFIGEAWCRGALAPETRETLWPLLLNLPEHRDALLKASGYEAVEPVETFGDTGVAQFDDLQKVLFEAQDAANPTGGAAASATLEYGIADFSLALMAQSVQGEDAGAIAQRSLNYQKLMDPETKWIRPRNADGSWLTPFQPEIGYGFQEGTSWQYSWMVMHDYAGVFEGMGGESAASQRLDTFFNLPASAAAPIAWPALQNQATLFGISYVGNQYAPGNEHDLEAPYVYNYLGEPWKTQAVARAAGSIYTPTISGMPGNDDLGALSGWLVWNMAGVYPMNPGSPLAVIGSPVFEKVTLHRPSGDFVIEAPGASVANKYVQSVAVNGTPSAQSWLVLPRGATTVHIEMGAAPNLDWGKAAFARPPSVSTHGLGAFGCDVAGQPPAGAAPTVVISPTAVSVANERMARSWSRKPFRTTELVDPRNGKVWSRDSADFTLNLDGVEIGSDNFEIDGDPSVQRMPNGAVRVTFRLRPSGFGAAPLGLWLERTIEMYPDVAGMRSETWLHSPVPLVISGYSVDEARPQGNDLTGTIHSFRAGSDWRNPGEDPQWAPPSVGDAQTGDWIDTHSGNPVGGTAQWMSIEDGQDARLFFVLERNDYASSQMSFDAGRAKAHVDLSRDLIYIGPFEETAHAQNPGPGPGRHRVVMPGVPLRLEPVFTGFGLSGDDEPWQHYKYLAKYRMPAYRREITFNSNGVDSNRISTGAKDDMDFAETQRQAAIAAEIGVETFILDDGWQARSGDWCPDSPECREANRQPEPEPTFPPVDPGADYTQPRYPARFPDSSFTAVREVLGQNGGMNLGLWMTPLHFNPTAEVFQQNPQWACQPISSALGAYNVAQPYSSSNEAGLAQWNLEAVGPNGKAVDYIEGRIRRAIDDWGVKYFKFDFTAWIDCGGVNTVDMYGYRESFMAMLDRILKDHPDVTIQMDETNDYRLFPFEALTRGPTWYQNGGGTTNGALHANQVLLPFLPPYALGRGAVQPGSFASKSPDYQMAVALLSHMTFFNDLTGIPQAARPAIRRWTDYYKAHRADLAQFTYPLLSEDPVDEANWAAFQTWNPETGRGVLLAYRQDSDEGVKTLRLRNVPDGTYRLFEAPDDAPAGAATAAQLRAGIDIVLPAKRSARVLRIERVSN